MRKTIALAFLGSLMFLNACPGPAVPVTPAPVSTDPVGKLAWLGESFDVEFTISNWATQSKVGGTASSSVPLETDAPDLPIGATAPASGQVLSNGKGTLKMTAASQTVAFNENEDFKACKDLVFSTPIRSLSILVVVPQEYTYDPNDASKLTYQRDQARLEYRSSKDVYHEFYWASADGTVTGKCGSGAASTTFSLVLKKGWNNVITDEVKQTVVTGDRPATPNGYSLVASLAGRI